MPSTENAPEGLRALLVRDHQELDHLFDALSNALHADARDDVLRLWVAFDDGLCRHMALEEAHILPVLEQQYEQEVLALTREHEAIRSKLGELGVAVELHEIRTLLVNDFIEQLRHHARREEALAYRWAEANLPAPEQQPVRAGLSATGSLRERLVALGRKVRTRVSTSR